MSLAKIHNDIELAKAMRSKIVDRQRAELSAIDERLDDLYRFKKLAIAKFDIEKVSIAESVMYVKHWFYRGGHRLTRLSVVEGE